MLSGLGIAPAAELATASGDGCIGWINRVAADGRTALFFLSNQKREAETVTARLRCPARQVGWWDPVSGTMTPLGTRPIAQGLEVDLALAPYGSGYGSGFLVVSAGPSAMARPGAIRRRGTPPMALPQPQL